jgi:hypothetical protein
VAKAVARQKLWGEDTSSDKSDFVNKLATKEDRIKYMRDNRAGLAAHKVWLCILEETNAIACKKSKKSPTSAQRAGAGTLSWPRLIGQNFGLDK